MLEWLKRHAWKACNRQKRFGGSNPPLSAEYVVIMKRLIILFSMMGLLLVSQTATAQDKTLQDTVVMATTDSVAVSDSLATELMLPEDGETELAEGGLHKQLKTKFIDGNVGFMSLVALALVLGLAFCIERIIYLNMATTNVDALLGGIEDNVKKGDYNAAKELCRNTRGPVASIFYQGLDRIDEGLENVEKSLTSYGGVQMARLEANLTWIALFIALAPSFGFLGTVIGMVQAFDDIEKAGDISPTVVAGGMKVALLTTIFGLIVAIILQIFYNYILTKIESLVAQMEDGTITFMDILVKNKK